MELGVPSAKKQDYLGGMSMTSDAQPFGDWIRQEFPVRLGKSSQDTKQTAFITDMPLSGYPVDSG